MAGEDKRLMRDLGKCPFCESDALVWDDPYSDGNGLTQGVTCDGCGAEWDVIYNLACVEIAHGPVSKESKD
jgi:hypothetical protein